MAKLDVLILTQPGRQGFLDQLLPELNRQIGSRPARILVTAHDPRITLGANRQRQIDDAESEYICFVDDDDWIAPHYFDRIVPLLDRDYVGFKVACWSVHKGFVKQCAMFHSLRYNTPTEAWSHEGSNYYRGISHLNPLRRELALMSLFEGGPAEDYRWATRLCRLGVVKTEHYIPEVLYHYFWRAAKHDAADPSDPKRLAMIEQIRSGQWSASSL